jgi:hypothetical protein
MSTLTAPPARRPLVDALEQARLLVERLERAYQLLDPERVSVAVSLDDDTGRAQISVELDNTDGECGIPNAGLSMLGYTLGLAGCASGRGRVEWTSELEHAHVLVAVYMPTPRLTRRERAWRLARQYKPALLVFAAGAGAATGAAVALTARRGVTR